LRSTSKPNYFKLARSASYSFGNVQVNDHHSDIKDTWKILKDTNL
jgi:hypothetical protein